MVPLSTCRQLKTSLLS